ncbi:unnamed protein product [Linum trigynum]|uniref:Uncharacterized protein n=1 Tax=Linum trigynum TaxID=586398 RepID=A0AAV2DSB7_9ROSI
MLPLLLPLFHLSISLHLCNFFHLLPPPTPPPNLLSDYGLSTLSFHQSPTSLSGISALSLDLRLYNSLRLSPSSAATISLLSVSRSPGRICRRREPAEDEICLMLQRQGQQLRGRTQLVLFFDGRQSQVAIGEKRSRSEVREDSTFSGNDDSSRH